MDFSAELLKHIYILLNLPNNSSNQPNPQNARLLILEETDERGLLRVSKHTLRSFVSTGLQL